MTGSIFCLSRHRTVWILKNINKHSAQTKKELLWWKFRVRCTESCQRCHDTETNWRATLMGNTKRRESATRTWGCFPVTPGFTQPAIFIQTTWSLIAWKSEFHVNVPVFLWCFSPALWTCSPLPSTLSLKDGLKYNPMIGYTTHIEYRALTRNTPLIIVLFMILWCTRKSVNWHVGLHNGHMPLVGCL